MVAAAAAAGAGGHRHAVRHQPVRAPALHPRPASGEHLFAWLQPESDNAFSSRHGHASSAGYACCVLCRQSELLLEIMEAGAEVEQVIAQHSDDIDEEMLRVRGVGRGAWGMGRIFSFLVMGYLPTCTMDILAGRLVVGILWSLYAALSASSK